MSTLVSIVGKATSTSKDSFDIEDMSVLQFHEHFPALTAAFKPLEIISYCPI